jgi:outer membrane protein TolC
MTGTAARFGLALLLLLPVFPGALAQAGSNGQEPPAGLLRFLAPVSGHPALQASAAAVLAAEAQLAAAHDPFAVTVTAGYSAFGYRDPAGLPPELAAQAKALPDSASQFSADLTLRPVPFGDIRDLADQRLVELQLARLDHAELLTTLEIRSVEAAMDVRLAGESLELARQGDELAQQALAMTKLRFERGAANQRELRDAEAGAVEAGNFVLAAEAGLRLAQLALNSLTGSSEPPAAEDLQLDVPAGTALSVRRAQLRTQLAEAGARNAKRSVLPVAQAGYTLSLDSENSVGVTLESRTLQPNLNYTHQRPGNHFPQDQLRGTFQNGVSASISPAVGAALRAAAAQLEAAFSALQAARESAAVELAALHSELARAKQQLELAELLVRNARLTLAETRTRQELGLAIPLATQRAVLEHLQAELELQAARQEVLAGTLAFHSFQGRPVSQGPSVPEGDQ